MYLLNGMIWVYFGYVADEILPYSLLIIDMHRISQLCIVDVARDTCSSDQINKSQWAPISRTGTNTLDKCWFMVIHYPISDIHGNEDLKSQTSNAVDVLCSVDIVLQ